MPIQPILPNFLVNGPNWHCCLAGSSKTAPRILIFSIVLGAEYSFYVKSIAIYALQKVDIIMHSYLGSVSWLSTHCQKVQFLHKYRNLPLRNSFHIYFMWFPHTKDLFPFNRNWWNDNILEGVFSIYILTPGWTGLFKRFQGLFCTNIMWKLRKNYTNGIFTKTEKKLFYWLRKTFVIRGWRPRTLKIFEITRTI